MTRLLRKWQIFALSITFVSLLSLPLLAFAHHDNTSPGIAVRERILLMRHAEKPDDSNDPNLAPAGYIRAENLPKFIIDHYGRPDYIFASANSKHSARPYETALPLSRTTGVAIDTSFKDDDYAGLAEALTQDKRYAGKFIVVIWHHGKLPDLAQALKAKDGEYPEKWKSSVYNQILQFDYVGKHHPVVTQQTEDF